MAATAYVIDVATNMPDAGMTTSQLDELSQSLIDAGASAETLEAATMQVAAQLKAAKDATTAANAALAEGNTRYGELERAALNAAKAAERAALNGKLDPTMARTAHEAARALEQEATALKRLEGEAAAAARAEAKLAATQGNLAKLSRSNAAALAEQSAASKKSVKEAEGFVPLVKNFNDLGDALGTSQGQAILAVGAIAGVAVAIAAVTAAAVVGAIALGSWAVGLANVKREAELTSEAAETLDPGLAALKYDFAALADETGAGAVDMREWRKQLTAAKVSAEDMPEALRAVALADAALGKGQGLKEFQDRLKEAKGDAGAVAEEFEELAPIVKKRMMGLGAQSKRLEKNLGDLFGGLNIDPVLEGFKVLVDLFDKGTASGEAMKFLFEEIFQPIIDQAANAAYVVEAFILGFLIGLTKLYIALKPAIKAISEFFGFEDTSLSDVLDLAKNAGEIAAYIFVGFVAVLGLLLAAVAAVLAPIIAVQVAIYALIAAVAAAGVAIVAGIIQSFRDAKDFLVNMNLADVGLMLMRGLVAGITGGGSEVINAIVSVAKNAIKAAKSALGIASPSKVFADIGGFTAEGFAQGVDDGAAEAQDAMTAMVEPPAPGAASPYTAAATADRVVRAGGGAAPAAGRGGPTVNINGDVYFAGAKASETEKQNLAEELTRLLEGDATAIAGEAA